MRLSVVTATLDPLRSRGYWSTWRRNAAEELSVAVALTGLSQGQWDRINVAEVMNLQGLVERGDIVSRERGYGVVPFFKHMVEDSHFFHRPDLIACFHDDVAINQLGWDTKVKAWFALHPDCVLLGFGGGTGLGADDIYQTPYDPMQLARQDFCSNMKEAEAHGRRADHPVRVACLDGFSLIGRADFMLAAWREITALGIIHHAYDSYFGVIAAREKKEVWMLPISCHHHGGLSAVGHPAYAAWANAEKAGDAKIWERSHAALYEAGRGILPIRI